MGLDDDANEKELGRVTLIDGKIVPSNDAMRYVALNPLMIGDSDVIYPDKEPERFLRSLYLEYRGTYCTALKAVDL